MCVCVCVFRNYSRFVPCFIYWIKLTFIAFFSSLFQFHAIQYNMVIVASVALDSIDVSQIDNSRRMNSNMFLYTVWPRVCCRFHLVWLLIFMNALFSNKFHISIGLYYYTMSPRQTKLFFCVFHLLFLLLLVCSP